MHVLTIHFQSEHVYITFSLHSYDRDEMYPSDQMQCPAQAFIKDMLYRVFPQNYTYRQ